MLRVAWRQGTEFHSHPGPSPWTARCRVCPASIPPLAPSLTSSQSYPLGHLRICHPESHAAQPRRWPGPLHTAQRLPEHPWNWHGWWCCAKTLDFGNGQPEEEAKNQIRADDEKDHDKPWGHQLSRGLKCCLDGQDVQLWRTRAETPKRQKPIGQRNKMLQKPP